jgi:putative copper export protein
MINVIAATSLHLSNIAAASAQLASGVDGIRIFLHVIGATIWVGGQFTLAALVPVLRLHSAELPRTVAHKFNKIAWPAYALLVITGFWNVAQIPAGASKNYHAVLGIKMTVVLLSGVAAYLHSKAKSTAGIAIWGAISGVTALGATYLGVLLAG